MTTTEKPAETIEDAVARVLSWHDIGGIPFNPDGMTYLREQVVALIREQIRVKQEDYEALEMDIAALDFNLRQQMDGIRAERDRLAAENARLRAAVEKVPHLGELHRGELSIIKNPPPETGASDAHTKYRCVSYGGRCAFDALVAEKIREGGE